MPYMIQSLTANGTTALGRIVLAKAILDTITNITVSAHAVAVGGTGYVVGETFELNTGTAVGGFISRGIVTSVSAGVVTGVKVTSCGAYTVAPSVAGATTNASGIGTGLTINVTTLPAQWTQNRSTYTNDTTDFEWICTSIKAANAPTIGMNTLVTSTFGHMDLITATGYSGAAVFAAQPGVSSTADPCKISAPGTDPVLYMSVNERRVNAMFRDGNNNQYAAQGLFIPFTNADATYPFPGICCGMSRQGKAFNSARDPGTTGAGLSGIVNPVSNFTAGNQGPYQYRDNVTSAWLHIADDNNAGAEDQRSVIYPAQSVNTQFSFVHAPQVSGHSTDPQQFEDNGALKDEENNATGWFSQATIPNEGRPGVSPIGTGTRSSLTVECQIISNLTNDVQIIGKIDGYEAVHGIGLTAFEEIENQNGKRFIVFPDTNSSSLWQWVAMEIV